MQVTKQPTPNSGFSLVELSIVLVILGLLTGGILAGQSLIRAAELRAVTTEFNKYQTAMQTFRDKYFAIPGDFKDATKFWGYLVSGSGCTTNSSQAVATPGACDGDGDGTLDFNGTGNAAEVFGFWQHLANAGLIEGTYTGIAGSGSATDAVLGENSPKSKMANGGWTARNLNTESTVSVNYYDYNYGHVFVFGATISGFDTVAGLLKNEEVWNIDTKMDDGRPGYGKIMAGRWGACSDASADDDLDSDYDLTTTSANCSIVFKDFF